MHDGAQDQYAHTGPQYDDVYGGGGGGMYQNYGIPAVDENVLYGGNDVSYIRETRLTSIGV